MTGEPEVSSSGAIERRLFPARLAERLVIHHRDFKRAGELRQVAACRHHQIGDCERPCDEKLKLRIKGHARRIGAAQADAGGVF